MFRRVLIANRGEVAVRVARACRDLGAAPIGVASQADLGARWLEAMDEVVCVGPPASRESYLQRERVLQAALQTGCAAVHPGWGFLAEDARFAALCKQHGVTFIGPRPSVMERMGRKAPAKAAMRAAGLPVIPGSRRRALDGRRSVAAARECGYPVLLKADAGGGGKGMRVCDDESELRDAFGRPAPRPRRPSERGPVPREVSRRRPARRVPDPRRPLRHAVHLGERECSVQRNHQKLVEESPRPRSRRRSAQSSASARAGRAAIGYVGAGTIEFLRDDDGSSTSWR